ncbi:MAG: vWA domain-containing protein [Cyclobacteriaceae bacterium]
MKKTLLIFGLLLAFGGFTLAALQIKKMNRWAEANKVSVSAPSEDAEPQAFSPPAMAPPSTQVSDNPNVPNPNKKQIRLGLLLDTSNSMDGLIDQAKSQLWNIVDELADAKYEGDPADLHIALYEYGNDDLSIRNGYVRQVSDFTQDLDEVSRLLFQLRTNGGSEYCGTVMRDALQEMDWGGNSSDLKMIFIAGNEPFNQGHINFERVCKDAAKRKVLINTIFCGDYQEGINTFWQTGATLGKGKYMNIDMDQQTVYVPSPYDARIDALNDQLNDTYIAFGVKGRQSKAKQLQEDQNAESYSRSNKVKRAISKSKHVYKNESWDLVDASKKEGFDIEKIEKDDLPDEMRSMNLEEKKGYLSSKETERKKLQEEIQQLGLERKKYVKNVQDSLSQDNQLEEAILNSVKSQAEKNSFTFNDE